MQQLEKLALMRSKETDKWEAWQIISGLLEQEKSKRMIPPTEIQTAERMIESLQTGPGPGPGEKSLGEQIAPAQKSSGNTEKKRRLRMMKPERMKAQMQKIKQQNLNRKQPRADRRNRSHRGGIWRQKEYMDRLSEQGMAEYIG